LPTGRCEPSEALSGLFRGRLSLQIESGISIAPGLADEKPGEKSHDYF